MSNFAVIQQANFQNEVLRSALPVLVEFGAEWCAPCKRLEPILKQLGDRWGGKILLAKVDVDQCADLAMQYQVMSVPTLILFCNGQAKGRLTGLQQQARIEGMVKEGLA